jgi:hypothetical protein
MEPDLLDPRRRWDPLFRNTFVCFHLAVAEDAGIFGRYVRQLMVTAAFQPPKGTSACS